MTLGHIPHPTTLLNLSLSLRPLHSSYSRRSPLPSVRSVRCLKTSPASQLSAARPQLLRVASRCLLPARYDGVFLCPQTCHILLSSSSRSCSTMSSHCCASNPSLLSHLKLLCYSCLPITHILRLSILSCSPHTSAFWHQLAHSMSYMYTAIDCSRRCGLFCFCCVIAREDVLENLKARDGLQVQTVRGSSGVHQHCG